MAVRALINTGVDSLAFINANLAILICKFFHLNIIQLNAPCVVKDFSRKVRQSITYVVLLNLFIDDHRQLNIPLLIADLGCYNIILGRI